MTWGASPWGARPFAAGVPATTGSTGNASGATWSLEGTFSGGAGTGDGPVTASGANFAVNGTFFGGNAYVPGTTVIPQVSIYITAGVSLVLPAAP